MQRKLGLNFLALMISGSLVKTAHTDGVVSQGEKPLAPVEIIEMLKESRESFVIKNGQVEIVKNGKISKGTLIGEYGLQTVEYGGQTEDAKIYGGEQFILGEGSYAYNSEVYGQGETSGQQNVYDEAVALFTDVRSGGEQNLDTWLANTGGLAIDTKVFAAGVQNVFAGGRANTVTLENGALQRVYAGGHVETLTINDEAISLVYAGAVLEGTVKVNGSGKISLYAGGQENKTTVEEIILNEKKSQLRSVATKADGSSTSIQTLSGHGTVIFTSTPIPTDLTKVNPYYSLLNVGDLSGRIEFNLRADFKEGYGDYLFIKNGSGHHTISVMDSGPEITNSSFYGIDLITDKSGKAHFALKKHSGEMTEVFDGGAYMYRLKKRNDKGGKVWYLAALEKKLPIPSSHPQLPTTAGSLGKETTILQDPIVSSYTNDFSFYADDFRADEDRFVLRNSILSDDNMVISDDNSIAYFYDDNIAVNPKWSINNTVEGTGILYIEEGGLSKNTTILNGGSEIVGEQGISESAIVYEYGVQRIEGGGSALNAEIYGGEQTVFGDSYVNGGIVGSSAYNTKVYGQGDALGQQNVYDDGMAVGTKVMDGGVQTLAKWFVEDDSFSEKNGGLALNTEVFSGGTQRILVGGEADVVILHRHAAQEVHSGATVRNLTIEEKANSWVFAGAVLGGKIKVGNWGGLHLYAGDESSHTQYTNHHTMAEDIDLEDEEARLYAIADDFDDKISYIQKLSGVGRVIFTSSGNDLYYSQLYVDDLSGSMHFDFNVSLAEGKGDYLFIQSGSGNHTISVVDSGIEIADLSSTDLDLIVDQSGGANFTLKSFSGAKIGGVDGGTYIYGLKQKNDAERSEKIWYLSAVYNDNIPRRGRTPRHLRVDQQVSVSSTSVTPIQQISHQAGNHPSDDKQHPAVTSNTSSQADQMTLRSPVLDPFSPSLSEEVSVSHFLTTPSTDAVLSMAVTPSLIFHNELQVVRVGRGVLDRSKKSAGLWTYVIKSKETISADHIDFKLDQTGIVLGLNGLSEWSNGDFYIGGFGSYDHARIAHARGGTSSINTYSIGAYATYFDHSGWYLDGILKYNYDQNTLKAVSTNGLAVASNYDQWVVGSSFEAGYRIKTSQNSWFQPYGQFTWLQVSRKEIKLSNEMTGAINRFTSLRSEVGLSLGYEFGSGMESSSLFYLTASWLRENKDDNHTMINEIHQFTTDLSGNAGKLGVGLSHFMSDKLKLYAQAHYVKGRTTKQSLQGVLGVRYSF